MKTPSPIRSMAVTAVASLLIFSAYSTWGQNAVNPAEKPPVAAPTSPAAEAPAIPTSMQEGFMMINGVACSIHAGKAIPITQDLILRISPNGTLTSFDGRSYTLPSRQLLTLAASFSPVNSGNASVSAPAPAQGNTTLAAPTSGIAPGAGLVNPTPSASLDGSTGSAPLFQPGSVPSRQPGVPVRHRREVPAEQNPTRTQQNQSGTQQPANPAPLPPPGNIHTQGPGASGGTFGGGAGGTTK